MLVEIQEVVALEQLIGKLGERQSVACGTVKALLHTLLSHHVVDGDMLSHHTGEVKEGEVFHPVVVVHHLGLVRLVAVEIEELGHLLLDALLVVVESLVVEQVALLALARGVADHAGGSAHEDYRLVAAALQVTQHHDAAQVAYMK